MLSYFCEQNLLVQLVAVVVVILAALKLYLVVTLGVCKSQKQLNGKTVIITGANTGIGKETALDLAHRGARIILACRDLKKATAARDDIIRESGNRNVVVRHLDLASLQSVRKFAADILKSEKRLDVLINNAGCAGMEKKITDDGLEYQMQSNYFGHFLLTNLLLGLMIKTGPSRIINVSSEAHKFPKTLDVTDLRFDRTNIDRKLFAIYGVTKLCNILFTKELAKRVEHLGLLKKSKPSRIINVSSMAHAFTKDLNLANLNSELNFDSGKVYYVSKLNQILFTRYLAPLIIRDGKKITVNSLHPGVVYTEFLRFHKVFQILAKFTAVLYMKTSKEGAQTTIHLAVADEVENVTGQYFSDCKVAKVSKLAQDDALAKKLWEISEELVKLRPEEKHF